ncbi:hypothetical protein [Zobellia galactanivorans]|uniref:Hypothetical membrane protein n=1 Tax=Zobellia galactanivorans (strain DSM 12802 / CCUG 47099 / CIP 106680 / NCIMB 13871 / Dsij) TaxID=63186 RepID=G0L5L2_ZOBGA|nr:hypothetical protein [Zobellia galactanivorans]CAZ96347.1 Hypothetical membrane protein [Zobellia galactanivorans]
MDDNRIKKIVQEAFDKAREKSVSKAKYALAKQISEEVNLSSKTVERAYDRYINGKENLGPQNQETIDELCRYIGYRDYADYVDRNYGSRKKREKKPSIIDEGRKGVSKTWIYGAIAIIAMGGLVWMAYTSLIPEIGSYKGANQLCMTWADSLYLEVDCNHIPFSPQGTKVEPLDPVRLATFKKVKVSQSYPFFKKDTGEPLVWYFKNKDGRMEYYTAPGLHPTNGETLRKITPYIIQKYVPLHSTREDSFVR